VGLSQGCRLHTSTHQRHDEIRDLFGQLATEISHVEIEPAVLHSLARNFMQLQMGKTKQDLISVLVDLGNVDSEHFSITGFQSFRFLTIVLLSD
jgi:Mn-containing catalase